MKIYIYIIIALFSVSAFAQEFKLGRVTVAELQEEQNELDPSAPATILYEKAVTYFDIDKRGEWIIVTEASMRIKIYNKDGYKYANIEMPYYISGADKEKVEFTDAVTYNLSDTGKIEKTKLNDDGEFKEEYSKRWNVKKITLPAVKEGSVIEYRYVKESPFIRTIPTWYFQGKLPIKHTEYSVHIPTYFTYNRILSPYIDIKETQKTEKQSRIYTDNSRRGGYGTKSTTNRSQLLKTNFYEVQKTYTAENVPALRDEYYVDNIKNYMSYVKHELASTDFPNQEKKNYASDWTSVVKSIYNDEDFGRELNKNEYFKDDIKEVTGETDVTRNQLITSIYNYVRDRMVFNGDMSYETNKPLEQVYETKEGNAAEINLMLVAMLRYAGLKANPVLISTRDNGHVAFVSRTEFNYVIAGVETENGILFLDATNKNGVPGILPTRALNVSGRIIRENLSSQEVELTPVLSSIMNSRIMAEINSDGSITGQVRNQFFDYRAYNKREGYTEINEDNYISGLERELGSIEISDYKMDNLKDFESPVMEGYKFRKSDGGDVIGDRIYISPMLMYTKTENPFKQDKRTYPIDFVYPTKNRYTINLTIPDGYQVESLPKDTQIAMEGNVATFRMSIAQRGNQLQMIISNDVNIARINPDYYNELKTYFGNTIKQQNEKIVLKKI